MPSVLPLPARRERPGDATRARIFEAALAEFRRHGVVRASVTAIARRAGTSRPSFYFHFPTREHVLLELQWSLEQGVVRRLERCRSLRGALAELAQGLFEAEERAGDRELYREMLALYARRPADLRLDEQGFPTVAELTRHFAEGAARGELRAGLEPAHAARVCLAAG
jgi:AcrR family transcriptional regulator